MSLSKVFAGCVLPCLVIAAAARSDVFDLGEGLLSLTTVAVSEPGNAVDTTGFGRVDGSYFMGTHEVTAGQYTEFLNAVASADPHGLYNSNMWSDDYGCKIERSGSSGSYTYSVASDWANRPVNYVSWGDAARFANWLHNGQPTGTQDASTTERGAYQLDGALDDADLLAVSRQEDWRWALPTEDEWYKAAYYDPEADRYYTYPTSSDAVPGNQLTTPDNGNKATYNLSGSHTLGSPYWRTEAGEHENSASPWGTYDQGGNVAEWSDSLFDPDKRSWRGGAFYQNSTYLESSFRNGISPTTEWSNTGFRVVSTVPEPTSFLLISTMGLALLRRGYPRP